PHHRPGSRAHPGRRRARCHPRRPCGAARLSRDSGMTGDALTVSGLDCFYGEVQVLHGLSLTLTRGEVLCVLGRNVAGKPTLLKGIMGLVPARAGSIRLGKRELTGLPAHRVPEAGIAYVPQGRRLFAEMTVAENIEIGLAARNRGGDVRRAVLELFPI